MEAKNNETLIENTAKVAAEWWGDKLLKGNRDAFVEDLKGRIGEALVSKRMVCVENDYDPQGVLLESVKAVIDPECRGYLFSGKGIFPDKHSTYIWPGRIRPKAGYGNILDEITVQQCSNPSTHRA